MQPPLSASDLQPVQGVEPLITHLRPPPPPSIITHLLPRKETVERSGKGAAAASTEHPTLPSGPPPLPLNTPDVPPSSVIPSPVPA